MLLLLQYLQMSLIQKILLSIIFTMQFNCFAQNFLVECKKQVYHAGENPSIAIFRDDNVLADNISFQAISLRQGDSAWSIGLNIKRPIFFQLEGSQVLGLPNQKVIGYLANNNQQFVVEDSNNINFFINNTNNELTRWIKKYNNESSFEQYLTIYKSVKGFLDSILSYTSTTNAKSKFNLSNDALGAVKEYYQMRLSHFLMLPILYKNDYTLKLFELVLSDIKVTNAAYWLQTQSGKIFLRTFFSHYTLLNHKFKLSESLNSSLLFANKNIRKYLSSVYFNQILNKNEEIISLSNIKNELLIYKKVYSFTTEESKVLKVIEEKLTAKNEDITKSFSKQDLENENHLMLKDLQKAELLNIGDGIILDYWASWCVPCIEKIKKLKSDQTKINGRQYKIIFISVDKTFEDWQRFHSPIFSTQNNFRLLNPTKTSFYKQFHVTSLPRMFLIENGKLKSENYSY